MQHRIGNCARASPREAPVAEHIKSLATRKDHLHLRIAQRSGGLAVGRRHRWRRSPRVNVNSPACTTAMHGQWRYRTLGRWSAIDLPQEPPRAAEHGLAMTGASSPLLTETLQDL
jgi:hypothetical protein